LYSLSNGCDIAPFTSENDLISQIQSPNAASIPEMSRNFNDFGFALFKKNPKD